MEKESDAVIINRNNTRAFATAAIWFSVALVFIFGIAHWSVSGNEMTVMLVLIGVPAIIVGGATTATCAVWGVIAARKKEPDAS